MLCEKYKNEPSDKGLQLNAFHGWLRTGGQEDWSLGEKGREAGEERVGSGIPAVAATGRLRN